VPELPVALSEGWLWPLGFLLLAVICANLAWLSRHLRPGTLDDAIARLIAWPFSPWLLQLFRLLYYIGVPFAALLWGQDAIVERLLGLQQLDLFAPSEGEISADLVANWLDWLHDIGWAAALGAGGLILLALGWWAYRRALHGLEGARGENQIAGADSSGWVLLREAAYHEVHWAFYRQMPIRTQDAYWGVWLGLALVALEAALNPAWRKGLADPRQAPVHLMRGALAVVSSVMFLLTQNLWLALLLHWSVSWGLVATVQALPLRSETAPERSTPLTSPRQ
jgi:hypothetical protein